MTHFWGYRIPLLVVPVVLAYAVLAAWWVWRGRAHLAVTLERVLLGGAVAFATVVTMSPPGGSPLILEPDRSCFVHRVDLGLAAVLADDQRILNVLLLVPVGVFAALVASRLRGVPAFLVVAGAAALPVLFEAGQQVFRGLNRSCDTTDLADNLTGVLAGLVVGALAVGLRWAAGRNAGRVGA